MRRSVRYARPRGRGPVGKAVGILGELLLTAGLLILLYVAYVLWGTGIQTERAQDELRERIESSWTSARESAREPTESVEATPGEAAPPEPDAPSEVEDVFGIIRIPRLGNDWEWIVVDDVDLESLARGPGHYPHTALPGEIGNVAIAGHRSGHGAPFQNLDRLQVGDTIEIERADGVWTYRIDRAPAVIEPSDVWVVDPVPGGATDTEPTERRVTLTTCHPRYGSSQRMFVSGVLASGEEI